MGYKNPEDNKRYLAQWRKDNKEHVNAKNKEWKLANPEKYKAIQRKCRTGWSPEAFELAWTNQNGRCEICNRDMLKTGVKSNSVAADHNHNTNQPRGLLCMRCNSGLCFYEQFSNECVSYLTKYQ